jgi:HEPN domain-containing protein
MGSEKFDVDQVKAYWESEALEALRVAGHLVEKEDFSYALFFGHLAVEKILKAVYTMMRKEHPPPTHNLVRVAKSAGLVLDQARIQALVTITGFNVEARYPD